MATLTQAMKDMIGAQLSFLSTVDEAGNPQVGPKGTMRVLDDTHLIYNEQTGKQAWHNLHENGKAAVATVDHAALKGFRFEGTVEGFHDNDQIYEDAKAYAAERHLPAVIAAVVISIDRIYMLDAGPHAGDIVEGDPKPTDHFTH
ncbi:pyridoxamine 5'-phosphate oxidase family protein [Lacticaseibacillus saniviri]|uniref:Pyridoxine 5-phosphate oxidase V related favin-nucleotide-binding protein n=1 Tax=Lacticaseibacillus saniviri JCM 17471 = DSM 24301 TaxID=1293598 RepID=A0A0R2MVK5_9LACO|nr:pyridoxamine 5'-phosphate oxidase family protein [Lacticaseibacillus saniviri]KRO16402.1 Pyridoxine 5-phosphate oxidase V related favin-nucleotide-binding protein [Lacticaseibacillus saniviri JCM 17471 = DSM 24301]MCG4282861.1 pyridoxamine 5'-phosphate oxidase family protein [Lacticaseibacillus saniviri]